MNASQPEAPVPRRTLRWYQFSLRTLFIVVTVCAILCSWLGVTLKNQRAQKAAAAAIERAGGRVVSERTWVGRLLRDDSLIEVHAVSLPHGATDAEIVHLRGLTQLTELWLDATQVTDAGLVNLRGLRQLQRLRLDGTQITDAGLVNLRGLTRLWDLSMIATRVTDAGLAHLRGLTKLRVLSLESTNVADAGLVHLRGLSKLECLELPHTKVTGAGLVHLCGLSKLGLLNLIGTKVTKQDLDEIREALPKCSIWLDSGIFEGCKKRWE